MNRPPEIIRINRPHAGQTIAAVLRRFYPLTWTQARQWIAERRVRIDGLVCTDAARRLRAGQVLVVTPVAQTEAASSGRGSPTSPAQSPGESPGESPHPPRRPGTAPKLPKRAKAPRGVAGADTPDAAAGASEESADAQNLPVAIVYCDEHLVIVNKPAGLTTMRHPEEAAEFGRGQRYLPLTLADRLPSLIGGHVYPVHRLDRDTTGLVAFARTRRAEADLSRQFRHHDTERRYLALVRGQPVAGRIESYLVEDRGDGRRGSTRQDPPPPHARRAVTHVTVREQLGDFALVECRLETGRTHQVRIHLGEAGYPLCGERVYDRPLHGRPLPDDSGAQRPMLHAAVLGLAHPLDSQPMRWECPMPEDMALLYRQLWHRAKQIGSPDVAGDVGGSGGVSDARDDS
jgi:23S rRNA pseudouridine1911/1915/1917 synthase